MLSEVSWLHDHMGYTKLLTNSRNYLVRGIFKSIEIKVACNKYIIYIAIKARLIESSIEDKVWAGEFRDL